jgi:hypothetical protein
MYFANLPQDKLAEELHRKVTLYYEEIERNGRLSLWRQSHRYYYAMNPNGFHEASKIRRGGESDQLSILKANHYRNLLQHLHVLVTQQRPAFDCRAVNTDTKSQIQTILGKNILEYYWREKRLDVEARQGSEVAILYGEAYLEVDWDETQGDEVAGDVETGEIIKTGDIAARIHEPINVIRTIRSDKERQDWYILRRWVNRYDWAARHPESADQILNESSSQDAERFYYNFKPQVTEDAEDLIPVFFFYHDRTDACPQGRRAVFMGSDLCLEADALKTPVLPVFPMIPSRQHGTSFGYSVSFDLLCVQEAIDLLYSTILSNQAAFGVQNLWMKPGSTLIPTQLAGGLNILESPEKPEAINLTNTPAEVFNFLQGIEKLGEVLSGINSVARGQPEASLKSGAALALVASQAVQFSNGLQAAYSRMLEDTATAILRTLQTRATLPRAAVIAGKNNKSYMKDFTGDDIKSINRVIVDLGNPVSRTIAGRIQMAQDLLRAQVIQKPEQYIQVIETGTTEPMIDQQLQSQILMDQENEALREGKFVKAILTDKHKEHIEAHSGVLGTPDERADPRLVARVLAHIQEHISELQTGNPALLNLLGQAPIQVLPNGAPATGPQGANAPQPAAKPEGAPGAPTAPIPPNTPPEIAANMPSIPQVPSA